MIIFAIKLIKNIRKAIAGRNHPHQLAWAVAFGVLLGLIPHGNLLAVAILGMILVANINHAMAAATTVGVTFVAGRLDPVSNSVGNYVLTHETAGPMVASAWQWPLMPWTDLNNTVVMGSLLIGLAAFFPVVLLTYPIFRWLSNVFGTEKDPAPAAESQVDTESEAIQENEPTTRRTDDAARRGTDVIAPAAESKEATTEKSTHPVDPYFSSVDSDTATSDVAPEESEDGESGVTVVDTRIDVIRMADYRNVADTETDSDTQEDEPMDEALSFLLRQLRDSQQRKAE